MTLQPNEERIREDLTLDKGPTFRVRALRKAPLSVTRVTYNGACDLITRERNNIKVTYENKSRSCDSYHINCTSSCLRE